VPAGPSGCTRQNAPWSTVIRLRHLEGGEVAREALRRWLVRPGRSHAELIELAGELSHAETALRRALGALL